ncbi:hypothetical protein OESDEN_21579 [Oesophagostomum dentatum]|uniref:Uncharacterized protein n=1 Tax=Oesophagostomum dentatum TaxID=61180 RepID=A0A0B1S5K6_OESDE|nr:hypothetical protein OESDEN_21579 [Oesophagostomum dentatum]
MGYSEDSREVEPLGDSGDNNEQHTYSQRMGRSSIQSRRVNDVSSPVPTSLVSLIGVYF